MVLAGTLDEIEESTYYALAGMTAARREVRLRTAEFLQQHSTTDLYVRLARVDASAALLLERLTLESLERAVAEPELRDAVQRLMQGVETLYDLTVSFLDYVERTAPPRTSSQAQIVAALRERMEDLGDLLETYHLSRNEDFQALTREAIGTLAPAKPSPTDWKSALGRLLD